MYRYLCCVLCIVFLACSTASSGEPNQAQIDAMVKTSVNLIKAGDFRGVALMYHYPPEYSELELETDLAGVENSLKIFAEEFGGFSEVAPLEAPELYFNIYANGGTHEYWEQYPHSYKVEMKTDFENYGPGYLIVYVADVMHTLEIRAIAYGLPVSGVSVERISRAGDKMVQLMKDQPATRQ